MVDEDEDEDDEDKEDEEDEEEEACEVGRHQPRHLRDLLTQRGHLAFLGAPRPRLAIFLSMFGMQ